MAQHNISYQKLIHTYTPMLIHIVYSNANTYRWSDDRLTSPKLDYRLQMGRYSKTAKANGSQLTLNCGKINAGTYKVNLFVTNTSSRYEKYVKGSGKIVQ